MLDDRLQLVQGLVDFGFLCFQGGHFPVQRAHFGGVGGGEGVYPRMQQALLPGLIGRGFAEAGDVAGEALPKS